MPTSGAETPGVPPTGAPTGSTDEGDAVWRGTRPHQGAPDTAPVAVVVAHDPTPPQGVVRAPGRRRRGRRRLVAALGALALALAGYFLVTLYQVWSTGRSDQARPVDAIVVLGAAQYDGRPSPQLAARLDHTLELWQAGLAPVVVVTGGNQPGDRFTEASASRAYLVARGVPDSAVLAEDQGRSTWESLANVEEVLAPTGATRVLLVTDPFHSLRARLTAQELGLTAYVSPTRTSPVTGAAAAARHLKEAAGIAVGRIVGFERLWRLTG
jgi:uncharacterized SAM-binding protein YcdF (DUF218 family)